MIKKILIVWYLILFFGVSVSAEGADSEVVTNDPASEADTIVNMEDENVSINEEIGEVVEYNLVLNQPIATYLVNSDDIVSDVSTFVLNGDVYEGSINNTVLSMWQGLVLNNIGKEYVAWRGSQYDYYIVFGKDYNAEFGSISGNGRIYHTNTYNNAYGYNVYDDDFNLSIGSSYVYTNVLNDYPALSNERGVMYEEVTIMCLFALLGFSVLKWIFVKR